MAWDDEKKEQVVDMYEAENPTPETSMEIVKDIADEVGESPNGVRMILSRAGVYVKKEAVSNGTKTTSTRVSKQESQDALAEAIIARGHLVDQDIVSKLTGKAAIYFTGLLA